MRAERSTSNRIATKMTCRKEEERALFANHFDRRSYEQNLMNKSDEQIIRTNQTNKPYEPFEQIIRTAIL